MHQAPEGLPATGATAAVAGPLWAGISTDGYIGEALFKSFVAPFELVSILLLAALIGAIAIARKDDPVHSEAPPAARTTAETARRNP